VNIQTQADLPAHPSPKQGAEFLGVAEKTIRRYIAQGRLKAHRVGPRLIRIDRESLLKLARPIGGLA
jgi:excisionase family DNA binding protein